MRNTGRCLFLCLSFVSISISCRCDSWDRPCGGRGLPRAAGGLLEAAADGERKTVHNTAMIQQGRMRSINHHSRQLGHIWAVDGNPCAYLRPRPLSNPDPDQLAGGSLWPPQPKKQKYSHISRNFSTPLDTNRHWFLTPGSSSMAPYVIRLRS